MNFTVQLMRMVSVLLTFLKSNQILFVCSICINDLLDSQGVVGLISHLAQLNPRSQWVPGINPLQLTGQGLHSNLGHPPSNLLLTGQAEPCTTTCRLLPRRLVSLRPSGPPFKPVGYLDINDSITQHAPQHFENLSILVSAIAGYCHPRAGIYNVGSAEPVGLIYPYPRLHFWLVLLI